jgi:hypothetical protein
MCSLTAFTASAIMASWPGPTAKRGSRSVAGSPPPIMRSSQRSAHARVRRRSQSAPPSHAPTAAGSCAASAPFRPRGLARSNATRHEPGHPLRSYPCATPVSLVVRYADGAPSHAASAKIFIIIPPVQATTAPNSGHLNRFQPTCRVLAYRHIRRRPSRPSAKRRREALSP